MDGTERQPNAVDEKEGDKLTRGLIVFFKAINNGKDLEIANYGPMKESVVLASLRWGIHNKEIKVGWVERNEKSEEKPAEVQLVTEGDKRQVLILLTKKFYKSIESDIDKIMPGGVIPVLAKDQVGYVAAAVKRAKKSREQVTKEWGILRKVLGEAYYLYRTFT